MMQIKIGEKHISDNSPCFIIAEAGSNFRISEDIDKNYEHALKLIDLAAESGADAVKFQLYKAKKIYVETAGTADYLGKERSIFDIIQDMELPVDWLPKLDKYSKEKGILFLCTPFDEESADALEKIGMVAYKIASYAISHIPLLKHIARFGKPLLISTGASDIGDIEKAVKAIKEEGNDQIILLQCTAKYPAPLSSMNLLTLPGISDHFDCLVGLSDHSRDPLIAPLGAVALGASVLEKHFTTDNDLPGPDHSFAVLGSELSSMVKGIRDMESALGERTKQVLEDEKELYSFCRRSIYAIKDIKPGESFSEENIAVLRGGKEKRGLEPDRYSGLLGKDVAVAISKNEPLTEAHIR